MITEENAATLKDWADATKADETTARKTAHGRDDAIRKALKIGAGVAEIVKLTGLTRARIYQIRDNRR